MTPLPAIVHLLEDRGDLVGLLVVHDQPLGVDPGEVDLDERGLRRVPQRVHAVAAGAVGADQPLLLGLHQVFHRPLMVARPAVLGHAVQQDDVDVVDAQLKPVALQVVAGRDRVGGVGLGLDHVLVAGDPLEGLAEVHVRAVLVGDVEEADAPGRARGGRPW